MSKRTNLILQSLLFVSLFIIFLEGVKFFQTPFFDASCPKVHYPLSNDRIDVVIPCIEKDLKTLDRCIEGILKYGENINRVVVVSSKRLTDKAEWFDDSRYPFDKEAVALALCKGDEKKAKEYLFKARSRVGWYYQQLLKLYAPFVIPAISSNVLILDADTIFINPVQFQTESLESNFNPGREWHKPYYTHMKRMIPWLHRIYPRYSGIAHHMLFQKPVLEDLFDEISRYHEGEVWKIFCNLVDEDHLNYSGASEYELYFNFALSRCNLMKIRPLKWRNIDTLSSLDALQSQGVHYVSCHSYMRKEE